MPKLSKRITDTTARDLPLPASGEAIYWCAATPGFGVRVSVTGKKAYVSERRVGGATRRRSLGAAAGLGAISADAARRLQLTISSEMQQGIDRTAIRKEKRATEKRDGTTLADALIAYVKSKRRGKDGLALKDRTKDDYLKMIAPGRVSKDGKTKFADGHLCALADKPITSITAKDIQRAYKTAHAAQGERQAVYAMQVLRAVLNWHGVAVDASPLAKGTAGKDRIVLAPARGNPKPIPASKLRAWWATASNMAESQAAGALCFMLLTGCRPGEVLPNKHAPGLLVQDVDLSAGLVVLPDTKARNDHRIYLSSQAAAVLKPHIDGKDPTALVFAVVDPRKTLDNINDAAETPGVRTKDLRATFASVAEALVSAFVLKSMTNHSMGADVTFQHYVGRSEERLREGWQTVADHIAQ